MGIHGLSFGLVGWAVVAGFTGGPDLQQIDLMLKVIGRQTL